MLDRRRLDLRSTAFHEAGHAVAATLLRIPFARVWVLGRQGDHVPAGIILGQLTRSAPVNKPDFAGKLPEAKCEAVQAFAGPVAECLAYPGMSPDLELNDGDVVVARSVLRFALLPFTFVEGEAKFNESDIARTGPEMQRLLNECLQSAAELVNAHQAVIGKVAEALLVKRELTADEVTMFVKGQGAELCR